LTEVIWLRHKAGAEDPLAHFRVSWIEGVRGTHNRNHEVMKPKIPFWLKAMVTLVGHMEWRFVPSDVRTGIASKEDLWIYLHEASSGN
jgi:hypothetical protein